MRTLLITSLIVGTLALQGCASVAMGLGSSIIFGVPSYERAKASTAVRPEGPTKITVTKYQFVPSTSEMAELCRAKLAEQNPGADLSSMKIEHTRTILGMSTCEASL